MNERWTIGFDFEDEGVPPHVYICDGHRQAIEVLLEPECTHPSGWTWEDKDWDPPQLSVDLTAWLNSRER